MADSRNIQADEPGPEPVELSFASFDAQSPQRLDVSNVTTLLEGLVATKAVDAGVLESVIVPLFVGLRSDPTSQLCWYFPKPCKDYRALHAINAARLAMYFAMKTGLSDQHAIQMGIIGLLYDVGMWLPDLPDVHSNRELTRSEFTLIEEAAVQGAALLATVSDLDPLCAVVAREHHERADGTGYPNHSQSREHHPYSRLFQVIDSFLGMIEPRAFRKAVTPIEALQRLAVQAHRGYYHEPAFRDWLGVVGVFPVGSFITLNTGELALVAESGGERLRRPTVLVLADEYLDFRLKPMQLKLGEEPAFQVQAPFTKFPK